MGLISELMGISFGQADIYRRALEKMHKPANKEKVDYFNNNVVSIAMKRGFTQEAAEFVRKMIIDNSGYAFNKCISGREKIKLADNQQESLTIAEMYKIKNDINYAIKHNKLSLRKKYKKSFGKALSLCEDNRLRWNNIKDIYYSGIKDVYKVTLENGNTVECTMNHSFPTPNGKKMLIELSVGDVLYTNAGHEKQYEHCKTTSYEKGLLTELVKIKSIEYVCTEDVYDVEMDGPNHNLLLEGNIVVSNSHAVCYSYISYYTAWIKVHYPLIFHKTMLNGNLDAIGDFLDLAREDDVRILPPSIKHSQLITTIENEADKSLRIGFNTVNGVGAKAVESIVANRPYDTINDFFEKNNSKATNKKVIEALIDIGAFDDMGIKVDEQYVFQSQMETLGLDMRNGLIYLNRKQLFEWYKLFLEAGSPKPIAQYEVLLSKIKNRYIELYELVPEKDNPNVTIIPEIFLNQMELNVDSGTKTRKKAKGKLKRMMDEEKGGADPFTKPFVKHAKKISIEQINAMDVYLQQVDQNGFSFFEHPLQKYSSKITSFKDAKDGDLCIEAGIILGMIQKTTSTNKIYYWLMLRTPKETVRINVWQNQYAKYKNIIKQYGLIAIKGKKGFGGISLEDIKPLKRE